MTLGNRIAYLRKEQKLSQEALAERMNVSRQAVSKWENDLSTPDMDNLILLAQILEVDVEYLATGVLMEDMEPESIPETPAPPSAEKPKRDHKKLLKVLLIVAILGNILFCCLWQQEKHDQSELEQLCAANASACLDHLADFAHNGKDTSYNQAVTDFRGFMQVYYQLAQAKYPNYIWCSQLYSAMLFEPEQVQAYTEDLRTILRLLRDNIYDENAYTKLSELNNLLYHGDS